MPAPSPVLRVVSPLPSAVPGVWHADSLGAGTLQVQPTGHAILDAQLPGGGWPVGAMTEVLQAQPGLHEWQLVLPALAQATAQRMGAVVVVAAPHEPFGPALQAQGLRAERLCRVQASQAQSALWATEQALRCRGVMAVLAWLPQAPPSALRRLQLAAAQQQQLLWVFRGAHGAAQASPAMLRVQLQGLPLPGHPAGAPQMQVHILKRKGPPLEQGLCLPACPSLLAQVLQAQAGRRMAAQQHAQKWVRGRGAVPLAPVLPLPARAPLVESAHALDRIAPAVAG